MNIVVHCYNCILKNMVDAGGGGGTPIHYLYRYVYICICICVCVYIRGRDFEAPDLEWGIHFNGVF